MSESTWQGIYFVVGLNMEEAMEGEVGATTSLTAATRRLCRIVCVLKVNFVCCPLQIATT